MSYNLTPAHSKGEPANCYGSLILFSEISEKSVQSVVFSSRYAVFIFPFRFKNHREFLRDLGVSAFRLTSSTLQSFLLGRHMRLNDDWNRYPAGAHSGLGSDLWVPSQSGGLAVFLHWHHHTVFFSATSNFTGWRPVPLWAPSQNGWLADRPHAHHQ